MHNRSVEACEQGASVLVLFLVIVITGVWAALFLLIFGLVEVAVGFGVIYGFVRFHRWWITKIDKGDYGMCPACGQTKTRYHNCNSY